MQIHTHILAHWTPEKIEQSSVDIIALCRARDFPPNWKDHFIKHGCRQAVSSYFRGHDLAEKEAQERWTRLDFHRLLLVLLLPLVFLLKYDICLSRRVVMRTNPTEIPLSSTELQTLKTTWSLFNEYSWFRLNQNMSMRQIWSNSGFLWSLYSTGQMHYKGKKHKCQVISRTKIKQKTLLCKLPFTEFTRKMKHSHFRKTTLLKNTINNH